MIEGLLSYPAVKDSGVEWLGPVPKHWGLVPNKTLLRKRKVLVGERHADYPLLSLTKRGVIVRDVSDGRGKFSVDQSTFQEVRRGDLVFCLFDVPETPRTVGLSPHWGMITGAYDVFECGDPTVARYLEALYISIDDSKRLQPLYSGLRNTIPTPRFLGAKAPLPPRNEIDAIARFLDHVTDKIERHISAKEKLVALLEEQKWAIIREAVTGQIDVRTGRPYSAYKPGVVDGLTQAPEHWQRWRLKGLLRSVDRRSATGSEPLLSLRRDHGVVVYAEHFARPPQGATLVGFKQVRPGQMVVNRLQANNGLVFHSALEGLVSPDYSVFEPARVLDMQYLSDLLRQQEYRAHFRREAKGLGTGTAGFLRLYDDAFLRTLVHLPPLEEQRSIVDWLERAVQKIDEVSGKVRLAHDLMNECASRLIADVVTGKVDVRHAATDLDEQPFADGTGVSNDGAVQDSRGTHGGIATEATS